MNSNDSSQQSPDSSFQGDFSSTSTGESLAISMPASSESLTAPANAMPTRSINSFNSGGENLDEEMQAKFVQAMSRPGPKSVKRKRLRELQPNSQEVSASDSQPIDLQNEERLVIASLLRRPSRPLQKRVRRANRSASQQSNSSASTNASNSRQIDISTSNDVAIPAPAAQILRSPKSSKMVMRSPPIGPSLPRTHRSMSSSLSSNDEIIFDRPITSNRVLTPPSVSPQLPIAVRRSPPNVIDDGNAHSNSGAPRRVNFTQPPPPAKTIRQPRPLDKSIQGG